METNPVNASGEDVRAWYAYRNAESLEGKPERAAISFFKTCGGVAPVLVI